MPKGGHASSGPPPDPNALRRNRPSDAAGWTTLPSDGRQGDPPVWPLTDQTPREDVLWTELWSSPQAVMWEALDQRFEVALFVRALAQAEKPDAKVELQKVVRQYMDSLGLSVQGMARNRWKVGGMSVPGSEGPEAPRRPSARDRMKVVPIRGEGS